SRPPYAHRTRRRSRRPRPRRRPVAARRRTRESRRLPRARGTRRTRPCPGRALRRARRAGPARPPTRATTRGSRGAARATGRGLPGQPRGPDLGWCRYRGTGGASVVQLVEPGRVSAEELPARLLADAQLVDLVDRALVRDDRPVRAEEHLVAPPRV